MVFSSESVIRESISRPVYRAGSSASRALAVVFKELQILFYFIVSRPVTIGIERSILAILRDNDKQGRITPCLFCNKFKLQALQPVFQLHRLAFPTIASNCSVVKSEALVLGLPVIT